MAYYPKVTTKKRDGLSSDGGTFTWPSEDRNTTIDGSASNKPSKVRRRAPSHVDSHTLAKRAVVKGVSTYWHQGMISIPEGNPFNKDFSYVDSSIPPHEPSKGKVSYHYDDNGGAGQTVYVMENGWFGTNDPVSLSLLAVSFNTD
jgi:hypothetical protein